MGSVEGCIDCMLQVYSFNVFCLQILKVICWWYVLILYLFDVVGCYI